MEKIKSNKRVLAILLIIFVIILIVSITIKHNTNSSPSDQALALLKNELGSLERKMELEGILYNENLNTCIAAYYVGTTEDIAIINLANKSVGLRSVYEKLSEEIDNAISDEAKQTAAKRAVSYPYDPIIEYNISSGKLEGWEIVIDNT